MSDKKLFKLFGLEESLKITSSDQLVRIRSMFHCMKSDITNLNVDRSKILVPLRSNMTDDMKQKFIYNEFYNNSMMILLSFSTYIYFSRISNYVNKANSVKIFKPLFFFTFCLAPLGISFYNSKLNLEFIKNKN